MIVGEIIERLRAMDPQPLALVQGAAELASIKDQPTAMPAAYVFITEEASSENQRMTGVLQVTHADVAVLIVAGNMSDALGGAASRDIEALKAVVRAQLIGWLPSSAFQVITHVGGRLAKVSGGFLWWEEKFATEYFQEA